MNRAQPIGPLTRILAAAAGLGNPRGSRPG
jgi:hypothetical protein